MIKRQIIYSKKYFQLEELTRISKQREIFINLSKERYETREKRLLILIAVSEFVSVFATFPH